jgi:glutamate synthase (NADPH/NADH) small chain
MHKTKIELDNEAKSILEQFKTRENAIPPKERLAIPQQPMPEQAPEERIKNTSEVALGYTENQAKAEALRCLNCKNAQCIEGCPVRIDIPSFIACITNGDYLKAISIIRKASLLPAVCGRVCPQETQCQQLCTVGRILKDQSKSVSIGRLERFVADWERETKNINVPQIQKETGKKVAVIGSGPASITVAADVRRNGHKVVIFEAFHKPGGVLLYGIPEFRLPKKIVEKEIEILKAMGVEIVCNFLVGRTRLLQDLLEKDGFDAVFIGVGAGLPKFMGIEGENLVGVYSANEYLTRANLMKAYQMDKAQTPIARGEKVLVVGGGNVAMDSARTALRLGAKEVHIVYRRSEKEMPARVEEIAHAKEEGIVFHLLQNLKRVIGNENGEVVAAECLRYELGAPDESGRRRPVEIKGSEFVISCDTVIIAIGNESNPLLIKSAPQLKVNKHGNIIVNEKFETSMPGVFAGGDIVAGSATVILAMGHGRIAANSINESLAQ